MASRELLNPDLDGLGASATLAIHERCAELRRAGRRVYAIGFGQSPFPVPLRVVEALKRHATQKAYLPVQGLEDLRRAVADHHRREDGIDATAERVLIGPGSKELIFLLQLAFRGEVLIPSPSWVSYRPQARLLGRRPRLLPTTFEGGWKVTPEVLSTACEEGEGPRLLILNYPNNPVGNTYSEDELLALSQIARRHRLLVLADEIYGRLHFAGEHFSMARCYPEGTILSSGLSKWCGAGGWRLGTFVFPPQLEGLLRAMCAAASETFTSVSAPIQYAAIEAYGGQVDVEDYVARARRILSALGRRCARKLREAGVRVHEPEGGFYLFPDFMPFAERLAKRGIASSADFCESLLATTGVATLPGSSFERPTDELTARLCFVDFDGGKALAETADLSVAKELPDQALMDCCGDVLQAIELLIEWLGPHP